MHFFTSRPSRWSGLAAALTLVLLTARVLAADPAVEKRIREGIKSIAPDLSVDSITSSPMAGVYQVAVGPRIFYASADGRYLMQGSLLDLRTGEDLTEPAEREARLAAINAVGEKNMIVYDPKNPKYTVNVFTDVDCGYCRKLHRQMPEYLDKGIRIRYLFYPRAGIGSKPYDKAVTAWCSDDRKKALTELKNGKNLPQKHCQNPVADHYKLGQLVGVNGTPYMVLENGEAIPGYIPPKKLSRYLEQKLPK